MMAYANGDPTLGEQLEEDQRRRFYTEELLKEAQQDAKEIKELRDALSRLVSIIDAAGVINLSRGVQLGQTSWYVKATDAMAYAKAVMSEKGDK